MEKKYDIFLSHSYADSEEAKKLADSWTAERYTVYADFRDPKLLEASKQNKMTAELSERLREKIEASRVFVFLASNSAAASGWMPWELGLAHGAVGRVHICYLEDLTTKRSRGREYMKLYKKNGFSRKHAKSYLKRVVDKARKEAIDPQKRKEAENLGGRLAIATIERDPAKLDEIVRESSELTGATGAGSGKETAKYSANPSGTTTTTFR